MLKIYIIFLVIIFFYTAPPLRDAYGQDLMEDLNSPVDSANMAETFTESIKIISRSKRIFILSNTNQMLNKGDFISLVLNEKDPVARALVGKNHEGSTGIKILKIYSLKRWATLKRGMDIRILKGDDSRLFKKQNPPKDVKDNAGEMTQIKTEEDLYDTALVSEDLNMFSKDSRHIKPDNIVGAGFSFYTVSNDLTRNTERYNEYSANWAYQFSDNLWIEGLYGRILMSGVPAQGTQTLISDFTVRIKYTIQAPFYSYFLPYIGYQMHSVSSPNAGDTDDSALAEKEKEFINKLQHRQIVAGVTILRRLVPGWFLKADLGNDLMNLGFAIEF